jgi:hypothetical protein
MVLALISPIFIGQIILKAVRKRGHRGPWVRGLKTDKFTYI